MTIFKCYFTFCGMQFVQTNMAEQINQKIVQATGGFLKMDDIINGILHLTF